MAGRWLDLFGTLKTGIKLGLTGVLLKNSSGNLLVRNNADGADAEVTASKVNISGNDVVLNSDAAGTGADWAYTLRRPSTGMGAAVVLTLPDTDGSSGDVLQTDGSGVLSWTASGGGGGATNPKKVDTTTLAFGASSPVALFSTIANERIYEARVIIDTPFNGTPSLSLGISGTVSKYMASTEVDLTAAAGTSFEVHPNLVAQGIEALIATYSAGGASAGSARIEIDYGIPA